MFYQPKDIQEALKLKAELQERAAFLAGGTDIVVLMNHGKARARKLYQPIAPPRGIVTAFQLGGDSRHTDRIK